MEFVQKPFRLTSKQTHPLQMKAIFLIVSALGFASLLKENLFPNAHLTVILGCAIVADFFSGIIKSLAKGNPIMSHKLQRTTLKVSRYGLIIIVSFILRSLAADNNGEIWKILGSLLNNGVLMLMIYTETVSILENIIDMNRDDVLSMRIAKPLHALITFKFHSAFSDMLYKKYEDDQKKDS